MKKNLLILVIVCLIVVLVVIKCVNFLSQVEVNTTDSQASSSIVDSKKNGLFLQEYELDSISDIAFFKIKEAWAEYAWRNDFSENKRIRTRSGPIQLNFVLTDFLRYDIQDEQYIIDWKLRDDNNGSIGKSNVFFDMLKARELPEKVTFLILKIAPASQEKFEIGRFSLKKK